MGFISRLLFLHEKGGKSEEGHKVHEAFNFSQIQPNDMAHL